MAKAGPTPFGYRREDDRFVLDTKEAPIRRRMMELFLEHQRKKTVAEILNAEGHRTRNGSMFTGQTIGRLLADDIVTGRNGEADVLVDRDVFERCQQIIETQKQDGGAKRKSRHLFAGLAYCSCGGKMYVPSGSHKYVCRDCKEKIYSADLEQIFVSQLRNNDGSVELPARFEQVLHQWPELPFESKRAIIEALTARITVHCSLNKVVLSLISLAKT